jgi:hypothetical protein
MTIWTRASYESLLKSRLLPRFSGMAIAQVQSPDVDNFVLAMHQEGLSEVGRWLSD